MKNDKFLSYRHDQFLNDVKTAAITGKIPEQLDRHMTLNAAISGDEAKYASNPDGGFLLPASLSPTMLSTDLAKSQADTGALTQKIQMEHVTVFVVAKTDKKHNTGSASGGLKMYRNEETQEISSSKTEFEQIRLEAKSLGCVSFSSNQLLNYSKNSFMLAVNEGFRRELIAKLNYERLFGSGVGEYLGIMNSPALITVPKTENQTAKTITDANVRAMAARCWGFPGAVWMTNSDCLEQVVKLTDFWKADFSLLGRPVLIDENCSTLGDAGDIVLVDWSQYLEGSLGAPSVMESIHVRFVNDEACFRFTAFNDGAPWWRSVLTPRNGAATLSPYITLEARG